MMQTGFQRLIGLMLCLAVTGLAAQQTATPPRPALAANQDTNSAEAYVAFGTSQIPDNPKLAGDAFFWATRLDPANGAAWYGRWVAHLLNPDTPPPGSFVVPGGVDVAAPETQDPDSLRTKALLREPLQFLRFDFTVADELMRRTSHGQMSLFQTDDPALRGGIDYSVGRFGEATHSFAAALRSHPGSYGLHVDRARAFGMLLQYDSAIAEMHRFLSAPRPRGERPTGPDDSPGMIEYATARLLEVKGDAQSAQAMYETVVAGNAEFLAAHAALGRLALARADTATALAEYGRAAATADPPICYTYGVLLVAARRTAEAAAQFSRSLAADTDYAPPYYPLAVLEESAGFDSVATTLYASFVARAPRSLASTVVAARTRLARLEGTLPQD